MHTCRQVHTPKATGVHMGRHMDTRRQAHGYIGTHILFPLNNRKGVVAVF